MAGRFDINRSSDDRFYFNLKAGNGEIVLTSQMYTQKQSAEKGIESVRTNAVDEARFERRGDETSTWAFVLKAANGEIIGRSQTYKSAPARDKGIAAVTSAAADADVKDTTIG